MRVFEGAEWAAVSRGVFRRSFPIVTGTEIRDTYEKKMSRSAKNGIDDWILIEIGYEKGE